MTTRAYLRLSVASDASGSIDKQRAEIARAEAAGGRDTGAVVWYTDDGVSGALPWRERPGLSRLVADLSPGDRLVCMKVDRLARSVIELHRVAEQVQESGAELVFTGDNIDTSTPMGSFLFTLLGALAEFERNMVRERVNATRREFLSSGRFMGKPPFGFHTVPNPDGSGQLLRPHPVNGPALRDAIERVVSGEPQVSVAKSLGMDKAVLSRLLRNPRLYGAVPVNDYDKDRRVTNTRLLLDENGRPVIDSAAALLTATEWRRLQTFLAKPEKAWNKRSSFGNALVCSMCTGRLYWNRHPKNEDWSQYRCKGTSHAPGEPAVSISAAKAEADIESQFLGLFGSAPYRVTTVAEDDSDRAEAVAVALTQLDAARAAEAAAATDAEDEQAFKAIRAAKRALRDAEAVPVERRETVRDTGRTIGEVWLSADTDERSRLLVALGRFVVTPSGVEHPETGSRLLWAGLSPQEVTEDGVPVSVALLDSPAGAEPTVTPR